VSVVFDTSKLPPAQRERTAREALGNAAAPMNVRFQCPPVEISYRLQRWQLGRAQVIRAGGFGGLQLQRDPPLVRQHAPELVTVGFQLEGSGFHTQNGHTNHLHPGDLSVLDFTLPFETGLSESAVTGTVIVPADDLGLSANVIRRAAGQLAASPAYDLVRGHLVRLSREADKITEPRQAATVGRATTELLRALLAGAAGDDPRATDTWHQTLQTQLVTYIGQHLTDPGLCAEQLARVHHISVRQVYKLWSGNQLSLTQWIISERLDGARRDLEGPASNRMTISAIAHRWGFADTTHFSRRFREAYRMSPREWRQIRCGTPGRPPERLGDQ
jgi:AraC-like DNA-binding protein